MKKPISKKPAAKKLGRKRVEDGILTYLQGGAAVTDVEFGETQVTFKERQMFQRGLGFRDFEINGVKYIQACSDERLMTITYLFH